MLHKRFLLSFMGMAILQLLVIVMTRIFLENAENRDVPKICKLGKRMLKC